MNPNPAPARTGTSCATIRTRLIEGCARRRLRASGAHTCLHLYPWRIYTARPRSAAGGHRRVPTMPVFLARTPNNKCGWDFRRLPVHHGAGAYICGEETALLGKPRGQKGSAAQLKPPFPGQCRPLRLPDHGQQCGDPSLSRRTILRRGGSWFAGARPARTTSGTKLFCVSGHVEQPGNVRGRNRRCPFRELIERHCRRHPRRLGQSACGDPGRVFRRPLVPGEIQICETVPDGFRQRCARLQLGAWAPAAVIVMDKSTDIIKAIARLVAIFTSTKAAASARRAARAPAGCGG